MRDFSAAHWSFARWSSESRAAVAVAVLIWSAGCGQGGRANPATAGLEVTRQAVTGAYCTGLSADFCDDFQDGNATSPAWTVRDQAVASDFTVIKDGDYVYRQGNASTTNTRRISTAGSSWGKVMVEAKVKILSFNNNTANWAGLYARYSTSANTGYIFALGGDGKVSLRKKATGSAGDCINATYPAGGCSQTVSPAIAVNTWYTLKFVLNGSLLTGYLNGTRVIETTDTTYTTGVIGVGSTGGATFEADEIAVNRLAGACDAGFGVPKAAGTVCRAAAGTCDKAETCDGTSLVCPADSFQPSTTVCRAAAAGGCDKAETCTGTSAACPSDSFQPNGTVCRAATGGCDRAETCSGTSATCPADSLQPSGTVCRAAAGACDKAETCSGTSATCPTDSFLPNTTVCRAAAGVCDVAEKCTGTSAACPADTFLSNATVCRAATGVCDAAEACSGTSPACPSDSFQPSGTVCRAATGGCDKAETCSGTSVTCPADTLQPSGTVCRAAAGACDKAETCSGTSPACPADSFLANTTVCRAAAGVCDVAEKCTGTSAACPADTFLSNATVCRAATGVCDAAEACTGASAACPADGLQPSGTVCRAATGACDKAETCTGTSAACPADSLQPSGTVCRAAAGNCDKAETCSGTSAACPTDALQPSGTVCRPVAGLCDVPETCSGTSAACPTDGFQPNTTVCRPSAGLCDVTETCSGTSAACPADVLLSSGTVCRPSAGDCDVAETCSGTSAACPADGLLPSGTVCRPSTGVCDPAETCTGTSALCPQEGLTEGAVDRVLGMETPTTDWAILYSQPGTLSSSTTASQGTHSLSIQAPGWVPLQSVPLTSLGLRVGNALRFDMQFQGAQVNQYWWGDITIGADIPSLGVQASQNGLIASSFNLTDKLLSSGWTTLSFDVPAELQTLLKGSYDDLQFTIILNLPAGSTGTYLIDNLWFMGGVSPTPPLPVPAPPANLVATPGDATVQLTWTASSGATGYKIVRTGGQGPPAQFSTTDPSYTDSSVVNWTTYYYVVTALGPCGDSTPSAAVSATPAARTKITLYFPKGVTRDSVALGANGILRVNDGDKVLDGAGAPMAVSNAGSGETNLGAYSTVGPVTSVASVLLRSWGTILGEVQTGGTFTKQAGAQTSGTPREHVTLTPLEEFSWSVPVPTSDQGALILQPDADRAITPGAYAQVTVNSRAKLRLTAGSYYFASLDLEPQSELHLDKTAGPIMVYVTGGVILRGGLVDEGGAQGDFLLVSLGTQDVSLEQAFTGTIVVPNAKLSLATVGIAYRGTFFARDIESHQQNDIVALRFGWDEDCVQFGCLAPDECHLAGVCNPETRRCSDPAEVDPSVICDDGDSCTLDHCEPGQGCVHLPGGCSESQLCSTPANGDPSVLCDDGDSCTLDHCDPQVGCVHTPESADGCSLSVQPKLTCVALRGNGTRAVAVFGYENPNTASINIPGGNDNDIGKPAGATIYPYLPEWFKPGTVSAAVAVDFEPGPEVTWSLKGVTVTADANSKPSCPSYDEGTGTVTLPGGGTFIADPGQSYQAGYADSIVPSQASGAIRGSFAVTDDGAATYRLPLWVPPGLMGVQPQLALSYNSTGGDSFLGRGWQLQGMSQILRCRQDFARDKKRQSIQWNDDDRLCLDGQRLVLTKGTYNAAGAEYRTEHDRFLKIVQVGKDSYGPTGFVVYQPDGTRHSYGYDSAPASAAQDFFGEATALLDGWMATISVVDGTTADPTVSYDTQVRYGWALASSRDRFDNRVQYSYYQQYSSDALNRWTDFRPAYIKYTFNKLRDADREIDFDYTTETGTDARVDTRFSFVSGLQLRLGHLLSNIKMYGGASGAAHLVKYYSMGYQQAARTSALLKTVQECDGSGICSQPTIFTWSTNNETYERIPTGKHADHNTPGGHLTPGMLRLGDFNGDGRDDLVTGRMYWVDQVPRAFLEYSYSLANASGSQPPFWGGGLLGDWLGPLIDLNGDGTTDFFTSDINGNPACAYFCKAGTCTKSSTSCGNDYAWGVPYVGDLDGDGLSDLIAAFKAPGDTDYHYGYMANSTSGFANQYVRFNESLTLTDLANAYVSDLDGSGKAQFLFSDTSLKAPNGKPSTFMRIMADPTSYSVTSSLKNSVRTPGSMRYQFADLNGDGLPDAIEIPNAGGDVRIAINTGRGFLPPKAANLSSDSMFGQSLALADSADWYIDPGVRIVDVNLDGRADILYLGGGCRGVTSGNPVPISARDKIITLAADNDRNGSVSLVPTVSSYNRGEGTVVGPPGSTVCVGYDGSQVLDVNGDGLADFIQSELAQNGDLVLYQRQGEPPGLLKNVRDGYGATVDVTYAPMSDSTVYTRIECSYPQVCNQRGRWLVASHTFEKGTLTERPLTHTYTGARADVTGIGWLGMDEHTATEAATTAYGAITTTTKYDLDPSQNVEVNTYPKIGRPVERTEAFNFLAPPVQALIRTSTFDQSFAYLDFTDGAGHVWRRVVRDGDGVVTEETAVQGSGGSPVTRRVIRKSSESRTYHWDFGYVTTRTGYIEGEKDGNAFDQDFWALDYYDNDVENWLGGRLRREEAHSVVEGVEGVRVKSYEYDLNTNALHSTSIEPDSVDPNLYKKTVLTRNRAGQVVDTTEYVLDPKTLTPTPAQSTQVLAYDPVSGIFPSLTRNALGQVTSQVYHPWLGVLVSEADANGFETRRKYDGFGRLRSERTPDGALKQVGYYVADQSKPTSTATHSIVVTQNGVSSTSYYDSADRLVSVVKMDEKGAPYQTLIWYDKYGREASKWRPYPSSQKGTEQILPHLNSTYDSVGRPLLQQFVSGGAATVYSSKSWDYDGVWTAAVESGLGHGPDNTTTTTTSGAGRMKRATEKLTVKGAGGASETKDVTTQFFYRPFGQLGFVQDDHGNLTSMTYDARGRRRSVQDGDTGATASDYDAFDQLTKETYQDASWVSRSYDALGRMTSETTKAGATNFTIWDASANGIGKVSARISMDGVTTDFDYDGAGRPSGETWRFGFESHRVDYAHDQYGRLAGVAYPEVAGQRRAIYYGYDPKTGEQSTASLGDPVGPEKTIWTAQARDPDRRILSESFGDGSEQHSAYDDPRGLLTSRKTQKDATDPGTTIGFTYDARGHLLTRQQYLTGQGETFTHDEMGRLTKWESTGGSANWKVEYGYDSIGNLQSREESLDGTSQGVKTFATGYTDACKNTAGPHAVTTVTFAGTTQCYGYDVRGQQTVGADQRALSYTEFGLPAHITRNDVEWQFGYDAQHLRATKSGPGGSTIYVGSLYEKRANTDGTESHVMYVLAGGDVKAQIVVDGTGGGEKIDYLMRDHLGSVTTTGGDGDWQDMRFDPYGSRIAPTPPPTSISGSPSSTVRLGFTGQEEDDDLALVNMNGRIYDPALARFLTPDPLVSMRSPSQSWNRYSYAENSPLRFVDPSGFIGEDGSSGGSGPMAGYPPGTYTPMYSPSGSYLALGGFSGSYGTITVGPPVGSFDEAGAGASAGITAGMVQLQQQLEGGDIQARGWEAAALAGYESAIAGMMANGELGGPVLGMNGQPVAFACGMDNCNHNYDIERTPEYQRAMNQAFLLDLGVGLAFIGGGVALPRLIQLSFGAGVPHYFWLGGAGYAGVIAREAAEADGAVTFDMTLGGRMVLGMANVAGRFSYEMSVRLIEWGSVKFAQAASGTYQVFMSLSQYAQSADRILLRLELPQLLQNPNVQYPVPFHLLP